MNIWYYGAPPEIGKKPFEARKGIEVSEEQSDGARPTPGGAILGAVGAEQPPGGTDVEVAESTEYVPPDPSDVGEHIQP